MSPRRSNGLWNRKELFHSCRSLSSGQNKTHSLCILYKRKYDVCKIRPGGIEEENPFWPRVFIFLLSFKNILLEAIRANRAECLSLYRISILPKFLCAVRCISALYYSVPLLFFLKQCMTLTYEHNKRQTERRANQTRQQFLQWGVPNLRLCGWKPVWLLNLQLRSLEKCGLWWNMAFFFFK